MDADRLIDEALELYDSDDADDDHIDDYVHNRDWQDNFDDELEEDYLVLKYGPSLLVQDAREPEHVRKLLNDGAAVTANAVFAAVDCGCLGTLELLLARGGDPNGRLAGNSSVTDLSETMSAETSSLFARKEVEWYPLTLAAHERCLTNEARDQRVKIMTLLLDRGADIFALFRQPLRPPEHSSSPGGPDPPANDTQDSNTAGDTTPSANHVNNTNSTQTPPTGVRSLFHALLEDGGHVSTIFNYLGKTIDLEHRDSQGRTLLLSACRSSLGADARLDSSMEDVEWDPTAGSYRRDPFSPAPTSSTPPPSLFQYLINAGANPLATDHTGKSLLHHLLESQDTTSNYIRPPMIRESLSYALANFPDLLNQPDDSGTYPLHTALQRLCRYPVEDLQTKRAGLETMVDEMLDAGADPHVRDGRGNTVLHYLAGKDRSGTRQRLFGLFVARGVDVDARNDRGFTAGDLDRDEQ